MEERAQGLALYIIDNRTHCPRRGSEIQYQQINRTDLFGRLPTFNRPLYLQVKQILGENKTQRHIRGGIATKRKYRGVGGRTPLLPIGAGCGIIHRKKSRTLRKER